ncbi:hypothetical protein [Capnocytophaga gingivalis]|uniref:hypothetical protein n=1 Tax=Capnocytophaga gingivalis TaxID=1017 RepID=UPI0028897D78|nr:hypothetical protein [Capnocytophaga gingivalis]
MEYKEYKEYIQREFQYITKDNILFWNLWNISYPFDVLATSKEVYSEEYTLFSEMYFSCWEMLYQVDEKREVLVSIFEQTYPFVIDEQGEIINPKNILQQKYESYDDEILPELCILLLIGRFDEIYKGIKQKAERYGERAIKAPMEVISYIIASYKWGYLFDNMDKSIVRDEVNAQMKLVKTLQTPCLFSLENRNIFRNK